MSEVTCNGFKLRGLNQDSNRVAVKSSVATTWMLTYLRPGAKRPIYHDVAMNRDELIVIKCEDGSGHAAIEITPLGEKVGTIIAQSSRKSTKVLRVGVAYRFEMDPGESIVLRGSKIIHPYHRQGIGAAV